MSAPAGEANGPQKANAAALARNTTKATGMVTTNQRSAWAATTSVVRSDCAPTPTVMSANISGSS